MREMTVLVVDDEASLRRLLARALQEQGFAVREAETGEDALRILEEQNSKITLLVTDIMMPGISGLELAEKWAEFRPDLPVLLISGFAGDAVPRSASYLQKPFTVSAFIHEVLRIVQPIRAQES